MPRGGSRAGAGRKKGKGNKRTREAVAKAEAEGVMPLDVMLFQMRRLFDAGNYSDAAEIAKDAAPYLHAKRASVQVEHSGGGKPVLIEIVEVNRPADALALSS